MGDDDPPMKMARIAPISKGSSLRKDKSSIRTSGKSSGAHSDDRLTQYLVNANKEQSQMVNSLMGEIIDRSHRDEALIGRLALGSQQQLQSMFNSATERSKFI